MKQKEEELGFGTRTSGQKNRLINPDGSFNIDRKEKSAWTSLSFYHYLISISWLKFNLMVLSYYLFINFLFAIIYFSAGADGLNGLDSKTDSSHFWNAFFFSTQTITTIGYGKLSPANHIVNSIAAMEGLIGMLSFALITGILYGRFARPIARILFSKTALIAPFQDKTAFQFRIANKMRNSQIVDISARVIVAKYELENGKKIRKFRSLKLEIQNIIFFPMTWTVNHPIDEESPLWNMSKKDLEEQDCEFMILLSGFDDTFSQTVNKRFSYTYDEVVFNARFVSVFGLNDEGVTSQDLNKIDDYVLE